jgi:ferredoxin
MLCINLFHTESRLFMKVEVDAHRCQGHTLCAMAAPELFELSDIDGHATAVDAEVSADREETAREAARSCPEQAITIL